MSVDLPFGSLPDLRSRLPLGVREPLLPVPIVVLETCRSPVADLDLTVAYRRGRRVWYTSLHV